jgi:hypothetical protein
MSRLRSSAQSTVKPFLKVSLNFYSVNVSIPKAAFGRGARKRRREIDAPPADAGEEQQDMAALIGG